MVTPLHEFLATKPKPDDLVAHLLTLEKQAKQDKVTFPFEQLAGEWRLTFITGTRKAQQQAGVMLGKGFYLPKWLTIAIAYSASTNAALDDPWQRGEVKNTVQLAALKLTVAGCIKYQAAKRLLAFDFTQMTVQLAGATLYDGAMRGGTNPEVFHTTPIAKQAFFSYFYVSEQAIAARGRGGGLAIWTKK